LWTGLHDATGIFTRRELFYRYVSDRPTAMAKLKHRDWKERKRWYLANMRKQLKFSTINNLFFDVTPCSLVEAYGRIGETC
jgi:hypothetical protein